MKSTCYCIVLRSATRRLTALYDAALEPAGINIAQFSLLRKLDPEKPVSLTELGRRAELDRSTIGRNIRVLQRMGLVDLAASKDQREAGVVLTAEGTATLDRSVPLWDAAQRDIGAKLGPAADDLVALLGTL